jgi:Domain of unknown function (DUF4279)
MRSDAAGTVSAFATLRFAADSLDPAELTSLLGQKPTLSYKKGETYRPGPRSPDLIGKTGVWYFSTRRAIQSRCFQDHLDLIARILTEDPPHWLGDPKLSRVRQIVESQSLEPTASCFWHGVAGAKAPSIPAGFRKLVQRIHGRIDTDFDTEEERSRGPRAAVA